MLDKDLEYSVDALFNLLYFLRDFKVIADKKHIDFRPWAEWIRRMHHGKDYKHD